MDKEYKKLMILNRQPTLWRHGIAAVKVLPEDNDNDTIALHPLILEAYGADFDGDTVANYVIHDDDALKELYEKAYIKNVYTYDSDGSYLSKLRHESLYAAFVLTTIKHNNSKPIIIKSLDELPEQIENYNNLDIPYEYNNIIYSYGQLLLNKWIFKDIVKVDFEVSKSTANKLSEIIHKHYDDKFYDVLGEVQRKLFYFITISKYCPTLDIDEMTNVITDKYRDLFNQLPDNNPTVGYIINESLIDKVIDGWDRKSKFYMLYKSGSRFNKQQLARTCINIGYCADDKNIVVRDPIRTNLITGLTNVEFFAGSPGAKKGMFITLCLLCPFQILKIAERSEVIISIQRMKHL